MLSILKVFHTSRYCARIQLKQYSLVIENIEIRITVIGRWIRRIYITFTFYPFCCGICDYVSSAEVYYLNKNRKQQFYSIKKNFCQRKQITYSPRKCRICSGIFSFHPLFSRKETWKLQIRDYEVSLEHNRCNWKLKLGRILTLAYEQF